MSNCALNALQGLNNVTLEAVAAFWYRDPTLRKCTLTWYRRWHYCQVVSRKRAPGWMVTLRVVLQNHESEYPSWNQDTYPPPLHCRPPIWHLFDNIHIRSVITKPWPLRIIWYEQPSIHRCIFFVVTEFPKQSTQSFCLSRLRGRPCCRTSII